MELKKTQDLFFLKKGESISKRNLFDLIQYSKVESSPYWSGNEFVIGNTPQQGINWVGYLPSVRAVIIKTRPGSYKDDGWINDEKEVFHYSFKARNEIVNYKEKANEVLIKQPQHLYPVFLFTESKEGWLFEGDFSVSEIADKFVTLHKRNLSIASITIDQSEVTYQEGERRYVTHLMVERNKSVVYAVKNSNSWICEICNVDFEKKYGVKYIEAHHKTPVSTYSEKHIIEPK